MTGFDAIIFDFDGVLLESEHSLNTILAQLLTELGHRHSLEDALNHYVGLSGKDFIAAVEQRIGRRLPAEFHERMKQESVLALEHGIDAVAGAIDFVRSLPPELPKAVASSSSTKWIRAHLDHLGLAAAFGDHLYSGREHSASRQGAIALAAMRACCGRSASSALRTASTKSRTCWSSLRRANDRSSCAWSRDSRRCEDWRASGARLARSR